MITLEFNLGIISGEQRNLLKRFVDSEHFQQRKCYDEYYINISATKAEFTVNDLMFLAQEFKVTVHTTYIMIEDIA